MDPIKVKLNSPIKVGEATVGELTFREATIGDIIAAETVGKGSGTTAVAATLAAMAGVTLAEFKTVSARDFAAISKQTAALVGNVDEDGPAGES